MPTPDRTTLAAIVDAARALLESEGVSGVTMAAVATRVGVRAPSLYKRVSSRSILVQLVAEATLTDLADRLTAGVDARALLDSLRDFSKEHPAAFQLVMTPGAGMPVAGHEFGVAASEPILRAARGLVGSELALEAARTLTAWATGFISMELNGGFNLGGDVDAAWGFGADTILSALSARLPG